LKTFHISVILFDEASSTELTSALQVNYEVHIKYNYIYLYYCPIFFSRLNLLAKTPSITQPPLLPHYILNIFYSCDFYYYSSLHSSVSHDSSDIIIICLLTVVLLIFEETMILHNLLHTHRKQQQQQHTDPKFSANNKCMIKTITSQMKWKTTFCKYKNMCLCLWVYDQCKTWCVCANV